MKQPACSFRMPLGSLLIKERYQFSDEENGSTYTMNPYLQYFIGLEAFTQKSPFDQSMMTRFRKMSSSKTLQEVNDIIIRQPAEQDEHNDHDDTGGPGENKGALILDATCAPQNIRFSTDTSLLSKAKVNAEAIFDILHEKGLTDRKKKPRTYREKAKRQYNGFSKSRKSIRKAIRPQFGYWKRDLAIIDQIIGKHPGCVDDLPKWHQERLPVIRRLYAQQLEMFTSNTHRVNDRIVSLS